MTQQALSVKHICVSGACSEPKMKTNDTNSSFNILRLFDVLTNFRFTMSETMSDYYL